MTTFDRQGGFSRTVMAVALLAALDPAFAQTNAANAAPTSGLAVAPTTPTSTGQGVETDAYVSAGAAGVSGDSADRAIFGEYNGLRTRNAYGLLDFGYNRRDWGTGTLLQIQGTNLFLETRELSLMWKRQGDWKAWAGYDELVRYNPYTVNTGLIGAGTTTPQVVRLAGGPGTGSDYDLKTTRKGLGAAFAKSLSSSFAFEASVRSEDKDGSNMYGRGMSCPSPTAPGCAAPTGTSAGSAILLLPEPINSNHTQVNARLSYAGEKLNVSGGYYGSFYSNANGTLNPNVPGVLNNPIGNPLPLGAGLQPLLNQPMALSPNNQAQFLDLTGNYTFTPTTRANFKLGYSQATQKQDFVGAGLTGAPAGLSNLEGKLNTTLAAVGLTSRPIPKLSLLADLRYQNTDDQTPIAPYNIEGTSIWTNKRLPYTQVRGKLQAMYRFTNEYTGTLGLNYESIDRGVFTPTSAARGVSALRQETTETGYNLELRRRMTENWSGAISWVSSQRDGSDWLRPNSGVGVTTVTDPSTGFTSSAIFMPSLADRQRDKLKLLAFWDPMEGLSLQFSAEGGRDKFSLPTQYALQDSSLNNFSLDGSYALTEKWSVNGYASWGTQKYNQLRPAGYVMAFDNTTATFGIGVLGKPASNIEVGGGIAFINDNSVYAQTLDTNASPADAALLAATGGLPDILFRRTDVRLFGKYLLNKNATVRADLIYQRAQVNDWAFGYNGVPYTYSDNTIVTQQQNQNVVYLGVAYIYVWQ